VEAGAAADVRPDDLSTDVISRGRDKLFTLFFAAAMVYGLWSGLASAGYLLAFNTNTLMVTAIAFTISSLSWIKRARPLEDQVVYIALCVIPIGLRTFFQLPIFSSWEASADATWQQQIGFTLQVAGLWSLVAVAEEAFRAAMISYLEGLGIFEKSLWLRALAANILWLAFHFVQRPFDPWAYRWYIAWLFISGLVMTFVLIKAGLGAAVAVHWLVNISS